MYKTSEKGFIRVRRAFNTNKQVKKQKARERKLKRTCTKNKKRHPKIKASSKPSLRYCPGDRAGRDTGARYPHAPTPLS